MPRAPAGFPDVRKAPAAAPPATPVRPGVVGAKVGKLGAAAARGGQSRGWLRELEVADGAQCRGGEDLDAQAEGAFVQDVVAAVQVLSLIHI